MVPAADIAAIERRIDAAGNSTARLKVLFDELDDRMGHDTASRLWWAFFGAQDAAET